MPLQGSLPQAVTAESSSPSLETIEASSRLSAGRVGQDDLVPRAGPYQISEGPLESLSVKVFGTF